MPMARASMPVMRPISYARVVSPVAAMAMAGGKSTPPGKRQPVPCSKSASKISGTLARLCRRLLNSTRAYGSPRQMCTPPTPSSATSCSMRWRSGESFGRWSAVTAVKNIWPTFSRKVSCCSTWSAQAWGEMLFAAGRPPWLPAQLQELSAASSAVVARTTNSRSIFECSMCIIPICLNKIDPDAPAPRILPGSCANPCATRRNFVSRAIGRFSDSEWKPAAPKSSI